MHKTQEKGWRKLLRYCKPYRVQIAFVLAFAVAGAAFSLAGPGQISKISDFILYGMDGSIELAAIGRIGVLLMSIYILGFGFNYIKGFIMAGVTQNISKGLRDTISQKINKMPLNYFDTHKHGDVLSRVTNDVDTISQTLNQSIPMLIISVTRFFGSLLLMLFTNVTMTITVALVTLIGFWLMRLIMQRSQKYFIEQQEKIGALNGYIEEMYSGNMVVKAYNAEAQVGGEFRAINTQLYVSAWKSQFLSGLMTPVMMFVGNFAYVAICLVGIVLAFKGSITFGVIVAFMIYVRQFTFPLTQIAQVFTNLQSASAASDRVFEFLEEEELADESDKTEMLTDVRGDVHFKAVEFGYVTERKIINNFSAEAQAGQKIAIVGPTGAGKTTMVNLLMRFYEISKGAIEVDGVDVQSITRENVHKLFCMVLQDTWLFEGTIRENIVYNNENISQEAVIKACKAVGLDHFIRTLAKGYDTVLDDKTTLSAGQKQQLTIARAMVTDAPMLILDEATSSVDTRTELLIQKAMDTLMKGRTSFVIAHRLSTIKNADLILVMKDGDVIESGTHDELLADEGFYSALYNSQFEQAS